MQSSSTLLILLEPRIFVPIIFNYGETRWLEKIIEFAFEISLWGIITLSEYRRFRLLRYTRHVHIYAQSYIFATERPSNFARVMSSLLSFLVLFLLAILHPSPRAEVLFIGRSLWKYASVHVRNTASKWQKELESLLQIWVHLCAHTEWCLHSR